MLEKVSRTYLCLIPKSPNAVSLKNFRPISLCNNIYKAITKIITNRIKSFSNILIIPFQSSFLKNRRADDNTIIIQEIINCFNKKKRKKANMLIKID